MDDLSPRTLHEDEDDYPSLQQLRRMGRQQDRRESVEARFDEVGMDDFPAETE